MKLFKTVFTLLIVAFFSQFAKAQLPVNTTYQSIATPVDVTMPDFLQTITDNSVPSAINITRITEFYEPWNWYPTHEYPKIQVWNSDQSYYRIRSWKVFDAQTHDEVQSLSGSIYPSYWSNTVSDLIWSFKEDGRIKKYFVSTNTELTVDTIEGYEYVKLGPGEGNIDKFDNFVALVGKKGMDLDVIIYDLQNLEIIHTETIEGAWDIGNNLGEAWPKYIDWISVSQSGDYVGIMWDHNTTSDTNPFNGHFGVEIYNTTDMQYLRRIADYGNHGDFGYAIDGREVFVQFWGPNNVDFVNMYYLDTAERISLATHSDFNGAGHISCRNIYRPGWAYLTISSASQSGQIITLKLDDSGMVEHFGHHFSSSTTYDKAPMAVPSPNGTKVLFKSDFGNAADPDLVYCFEAEVVNNLSVTNGILDIGNVSIYPNPANNFINVKSDFNLKEISIYTPLGECLKTIQLTDSKQSKVDISDFENGLYLITISTVEKIYYRKLIIK